jgi:hypothetical protein
MTRTGSEPPLTRQERLRRVILLCAACSRNIAYYRAGWNGKSPLFSGELQATVNSNFVDVAILEWCKLFGDNDEEHHWSKIVMEVGERRAFKKGLLIELKCESGKWNAFEKAMIAYRNEFAAHLDDKRVMTIPPLDMALGSAHYYHSFLIAHENDGRTYGTLPADPLAYYQHAHEDGLRFYGTP